MILGGFTDPINTYIDQTILKPETAEKEIVAFLEEVKCYRFRTACLNPCWVERARMILAGEIQICSVVDFPLGASGTRAKQLEAEELVRTGCDEIDMVMNIGRLKGSDFAYVRSDIAAVVKAAQGRTVKVIIETCLLSEAEKRDAARVVKDAGAHFVKTSTGFNREGARLEDVRLLRAVVGPDFGVKASGGIRDYKSCLQFIEAGANRIGTSAGVAIMKEYLKEEKKSF